VGIGGSRWSTLIIRAWIDEGSGLRARLIEVSGIDDAERSAGVADDVEAVVKITREWLARLEARTGP
jgi:hypothetical protein